MQARTPDPCVYYSCEDHFGPADKDVNYEQEVEDESFYINVVGSSNSNARPSAQGLFFCYNTTVIVLCDAFGIRWLNCYFIFLSDKQKE